MIKAAQHIPSYGIEGRAIPRSRYGDEQHDWKADLAGCQDCRVMKGEKSAIWWSGASSAVGIPPTAGVHLVFTPLEVCIA